MHDYQSLFYLEDMSDRRPRSTSSKPTLQSECCYRHRLNAGLDLPCADNIIFACRTHVDSHVFQQAVEGSDV
jgi:hypothetical protein